MFKDIVKAQAIFSPPDQEEKPPFTIARKKMEDVKASGK